MQSWFVINGLEQIYILNFHVSSSQLSQTNFWLPPQTVSVKRSHEESKLNFHHRKRNSFYTNRILQNKNFYFGGGGTLMQSSCNFGGGGTLMQSSCNFGLGHSVYGIVNLVFFRSCMHYVKRFLSVFFSDKSFI